MKKDKSMGRVRLPSERRRGEASREVLPASYGEDRVVLLPVEPYSAHVYWDLGREKRKLPSKRSRPVLRFHDITGSNPENPSGSFDVEVDLRAGNWYVPLWSAGRSYVVELGMRNGKGMFYPLVRSNAAHFPPAHPAEETEEEYMLVIGDAERGVLILREYEELSEQTPEVKEPESAEEPQREERHKPIAPVPPVFFGPPVISFMEEREEKIETRLPEKGIPLPPEKKRRDEAHKRVHSGRDLTAIAEASFSGVSSSPLPGYARE